MKIKREVSVFSLLKKFRSGCQMLSQIEWISAYGSQLSAATILGMVGLLLAVRDGRIGSFNSLLWLSARTNASEKPLIVPGLRNLGNNCFLNVVLQSLASCSSFRCFLEDVQSQALSTMEEDEDLPLLVSLADILEELSTLQVKSRPLNPHKVMASMQQYIPQFQLSNQQDAAEAFLHLLSCLRDELSESYMPNCGSLADLAAPTSRILAFERIDDIKEPERWQQQYLGPFNGILSSFLTCRSCSSEIMMDFGFFHTLSLSPVPSSGASMLDRFTLEDCIKRFLSPEHVENYSCSRCWHIAATKFLSSVGGQQEDISKLSCCSEQDSCDCQKLSSLQALPWSNRFSHAFKQLSIAHCPQILCLHLQRSSLNAFGELVKIQGHIYFPMILNLSSFVKREVGIQKREINKPKRLTDQQPFPVSTSHPKSVDRHSDLTIVKNDTSQYFPEPCSSLTGTCSDTEFVHTLKVTDSPPPKDILYRLVSVVEHFGKAGSGHYTVYRGVKSQVEDGVDVRETDTPSQKTRWFRISDSEVHNASEEDVLGAEATLLFYERI
ncbi:ubiquitin carboxyl-terminal hydrolase 27 isoform X2 [Beta vulgaris subsp. vulgaris]|nr:ubiquitin carboxyl-terminal hydrolase 27 isoform X2 [Beta vulgaris subsp. vulgaris]